MRFARILLVANGAAFALYGLACLASPGLVAGYVGMELPGPSALAEVAAMYGGLQAGVGFLLLYCALRTERIAEGLGLMVILLGALALARTLGLLMHGPSAYNFGALAYESVTVALAFLALRSLGGSRVVS